MQNIIQEKKIFYDCFEKIKKTEWTCMAPNCDEKCINSHVLQKNGILSEISFNNHIIEVKPTNIWEISDLGIFKYQEIGINEGFSFPGFCAYHDSEIFKPIESNEVDFFLYKFQCLFSYRGLCQEIRRKQQVELFLSNIISVREKFTIMNVSEIFEDFKLGIGLGIKNLNYYKSEFEKDIFGEEENFQFTTLKRPYLEVCTSAPVNIKDPDEKEPDSIEEYINNANNSIMPATFISIFPTKSESIWLIGEHKKHSSSFTTKLINSDYEIALSELLILRMEYWCMSQNFLNKFIKPNMTEIKKIFTENVLNFEANLDTSLNLFK